MRNSMALAYRLGVSRRPSRPRSSPSSSRVEWMFLMIFRCSGEDFGFCSVFFISALIYPECCGRKAGLLQPSSMSKPSQDQILQALRTVHDPDLKRDLVSLDMIRDLTITDDGRVSLRVVLTTPACPLK